MLTVPERVAILGLGALAGAIWGIKGALSFLERRASYPRSYRPASNGHRRVRPEQVSLSRQWHG